MKNIELNSDKPINTKDEDLLSFYPIAQKWSNIIFEILSSGRNFVFSIEGEWGSGKSSMISLIRDCLDLPIKQELTSRIKTITEKRYLESDKDGILPTYYIDNFNPWKLNDIDSLLTEFIKVLKKNTGIESSQAGLNSLTNILRMSLPVLESTGFPLINSGAKSLLNISDSVLSSETLEESQIFVARYFEENKIRKLIIIDDLDRLEEKEVFLIFKLVKTLGNIPGLVFILSFDRDNMTTYRDINEYLKKIIQHSFTIPEISKYDISALLKFRLSEISQKKVPSKFLEQTEKDIARLIKNWSSIDHEIKNLRDLNRLINSLYIDFTFYDYELYNFCDFVVTSIVKHFKLDDYDSFSRYITSERTYEGDSPSLKELINFITNPSRVVHNRLSVRGISYFKPTEIYNRDIFNILSEKSIHRLASTINSRQEDDFRYLDKNINKILDALELPEFSPEVLFDPLYYSVQLSYNLYPILIESPYVYNSRVEKFERLVDNLITHYDSIGDDDHYYDNISPAIEAMKMSGPFLRIVSKIFIPKLEDSNLLGSIREPLEAIYNMALLESINHINESIQNPSRDLDTNLVYSFDLLCSSIDTFEEYIYNLNANDFNSFTAILSWYIISREPSMDINFAYKLYEIIDSYFPHELSSELLHALRLSANGGFNFGISHNHSPRELIDLFYDYAKIPLEELDGKKIIDNYFIKNSSGAQ